MPLGSLEPPNVEELCIHEILELQRSVADRPDKRAVRFNSSLAPRQGTLASASVQH
jgi:hypothetical protein